MAKTLTGTDILIRQDEDLMTTSIDGELIGMSIARGACYGLNGVGTAIWDLLAQPRSLDSVCQELTKHYDVEPDQCRRDVVPYLQSLHEEGLVSVGGC
jgi:hypothetical protein